MSFYAGWSRYYDVLFPPRAAQLRFYEELFRCNRVRKLLDIGCGTGGYALEFASRGLEVTGIDIDEEMIARAIEKAEAAGLKARFLVGDMRELKGVGSGYDAAICIGNSLVHLKEEGEIPAALGAFRSALRQGGVLSIQIVNYDRVLGYRVDSLPLITAEHCGEKLEFRREYRFPGGRLLPFRATLRVKAEGQPSRERSWTTSLRPVLRSELETWFREAGYTRAVFYGGFDWSEHTMDSPATVAVAWT